MRIGIIGSRRRNSPEDKKQLRLTLIPILKKECIKNIPTIVSGGCPQGGDHFAEELADEFDLTIIIHYPDKSKLPPNPKRYHFAEINYARNELIARDSDILIALVADDRKGGTENTIQHFLKTFKKSPDNLIILTSTKQEGFDL